MVADHTEPWNPDRRWADPLIAFLAVAIVCLLIWRTHLERQIPVPPPDRISAQARLIELRQAAKDLARTRIGNLFSAESLEQVATGTSSAWDRALIAILAAEDGDQPLGRSLAMEGAFPGGEAFRRCYALAYLDQGEALGYAAHLLEARLQVPSDPVSARQLRDEARSWAIPRLAALAAAGLTFLGLVTAGIALGVLLAVSPRNPRPFPMPVIQLSGRGLILAFLGWFLLFLSSGLVIGTFVASLPALRPFALPMIYGFHAIAGITLLCGLEGMSLTAFWKRLLPGAHRKSLAWGFGFLAIALTMVLMVSLALSPFFRPQESPQRELMDLVAGTEGFLPLILLVLTISVAAPMFEEALFRGTLLPWLGYRLEKVMGVRSAWIAALLLSSLGFGFIHLQPVAMPVLSTLGLALGLAFLHTRNLWTAILVHGLWNGGVFLFYRVVLS
jgi:membrane protease YdiL (CAAX protease family)